MGSTSKPLFQSECTHSHRLLRSCPSLVLHQVPAHLAGVCGRYTCPSHDPACRGTLLDYLPLVETGVEALTLPDVVPSAERAAATATVAVVVLVLQLVAALKLFKEI